MRCFSFILILFGCVTVLAQENYVLPKYNTKFTNGDRATLIIESPLSDEELKKFENTKITDVIYVFRFLNTDGDREFEVIFSDPPKEQKEKKQRPFVAKGIEYTFDKERAGDQFVLFESDYTNRIENQYFLPILWATLAVFILIPLYLLFLRYRELRLRIAEKKNRAYYFIKLIECMEKRSDFEEVYRNRKEIEELVELQKASWISLLEKIDEIQYKPEWLDDQVNTLKTLAKKQNDLRPKYGI